ncbi:hypothetical protein Aoki45_33450 [Algoriphagus sp. oki45]|uniref:hypothetical protein n=1 Tax=Algoriphagus sp. oki45 TaxID=3067294 RepID=UPI0027F94F8A|nr:hypothetical protein Aoki45_33450 [Algoriphagus sp. oki45]
MISILRKSDLSTVWAGGIFLGLGIIWFFPWRFQTNDDVMMMWLVSGAYTGEPEPYAVFIHPWLSWTFSKLYSGSPEFNWYGLTWYGVNFLSAFLLLKKIWTTTFPAIQKHLLSLFTGLISVHFAFFPQFTLIAGFAALAGLMQVFGSTSRRKLALAYLAFFLGFSIRWESAVLISLGWIWTAFIFPQVRGASPLPKMLGLVFLLFFLWLGKWGYEKTFVPEGYLNFNSARAKVLDHPVFVQESQEEKIPESSDWFYVSRWMFEDLPLGSEEFLAKKQELDQNLFQWKALGEGLTRLVRIQRTELFKSMLIGFLLLAYFAIGARMRKKTLFLGIWIGFYLIFNHFNLLLGRVNLLFFLVLLFSIFQFPAPNLPRKLTAGLIMLLVLFLGIHGSNFYNESQGRLAFQREFDRLLAEKNPESPLFLEGVMEYLFTEEFNSNHPVPFLSYGWISRSPMQEKAYSLRGFSSQNQMEEFYLFAFQFPEPLVFPDYMNRISPGFRLQSEQKGPSLVRLHYWKPKPDSDLP